MLSKLLLLCFLGVVLLGGVTPSHAAVHRYRFEARLCTNKTMLTINRQFPGPTIYARRGDLVIVDVINSADHNITIHWHGVKMPRYPWKELFGGTLTANGLAILFMAPWTETYPFPKPHLEVPILLGDWFNGDVQEIMEDFLDPEVESGKTYLLRVVNAVMNNIMFFKIANHNVTVVGTDAAYTKPLRSDYIAISPGQTMDLLLVADQQPSHYYMASRAYASGGDFDSTTTTGIVEYVGNYTPPASPRPRTTSRPN
ncbi:hypothetical protein SASPL_147244 [Salvia splendens]|uniref:laccase n=1 Tax=Salvia splendens TaxID=180675 RepID=A0A8X8Z6J3_SALSN|nr:hypothetical protein SASPL_147244 [Salvia splendens]